jgi:hypothetical protein
MEFRYAGRSLTGEAEVTRGVDVWLTRRLRECYEEVREG